MRIKTILCAAALAVPAVAMAQNQNATAPSANTASSGNSAITVYNDGAAVVSRTRNFELDAGQQTLSWPGTPPQMLAESLWLSGDGVTLNGATVSGQPNVSPIGLAKNRIGQTVTLLSNDDDDAPRQTTLVSISGSRAVVRVDNRLELIDTNGEWRIAWPAPQATAEQGALQLTVTADNAGAQSLTLLYQRPGVTWHASYTGRYDAEAGTLTLQSLAAISNGSGSPVSADEVALIAGDVARASSGPRPQPMYMARAAKADIALSGAQKAGGGYYRYTLNDAVSLDAGATQLLPLMAAQTLDVEREYYVGDSISSNQRSHATIRLHFDNSTGKPLPAGAVRVYGQAPAMLLGEDNIGNTPVDAPVTLTLGRAFDITAKQTVTENSHQDDTYKRTIEISVYNAGDEAAAVTIGQRLPRNAEITSESDEHENESAYKATWNVDVPANGETTLTYSVRWTQE